MRLSPDWSGRVLDEKRLLQTGEAPDGVAGSSLWMKASSAKIVLGPEADVSIARSAPGTLAVAATLHTNSLSTDGKLDVDGAVSFTGAVKLGYSHGV